MNTFEQIPPSRVAQMKLALKHCPLCESELIPGPMGGAAQNFYCSNRETCRQGYNLTFARGQLMFAQHIGPVPDRTFAMYAEKKL